MPTPILMTAGVSYCEPAAHALGDRGVGVKTCARLPGIRLLR
jgi:hypothetical protein